MSTPQITLNDIDVILKIIAVCSKRGAFEATELSTVGAVVNKLASILDEAKKSAQPELVKDEAPEVVSKEEQLEIDLK